MTELTAGLYEIAKGYRAKIIDKGTKVQVLARVKNWDDSPRCRDCKFCKRGKYAFSPNQWWESEYCEKKPKTVGGSDKYF